jgi:hypothetical protein
VFQSRPKLLPPVHIRRLFITHNRQRCRQPINLYSVADGFINKFAAAVCSLVIVNKRKLLFSIIVTRAALGGGKRLREKSLCW